MLTFVPAPQERAYYGALFQAADTERTGIIGSVQAVAFLTRSKLPIPILKEIWTLSDQPLSNALDARTFAVAVRLVQLAQHNIPLPPTAAAGGSGATDLALGFPTVRPAFFEGIPQPPMAPTPPQQQQQQQQQQPPSSSSLASSAAAQPTPLPQHSRAPPSGGASVTGVSVSGNASYAPQPPHHVTIPPRQPPTPVHTQQQQQQQLTVQDPYLLTPSDLYRYDQMFPEYASPSDPNFLYGAEAVALFEKSGLPREALSQIWTMADSEPVDNRLDKLEFALAMHLVICVSIKRLPLPPTLPHSLLDFKRIQRRQQQEQQQQPTHNQPAALGNNGAVMSPSAAAAAPPPSSSMSAATAAHTRQTAAHTRQTAAPPTPSMTGSATQGGFGVMPPQITASHVVREQPMRASGGGGPLSSSSSMPGGPPLSGMQGPPPLTQGGGLSISDAFEGLGGTGDTGSISSYGAASPSMHAPPSNGFAVSSLAYATPSSSHNDGVPPSLNRTREDVEEVEPVVTSLPATTQQLASSYDMGETNEELIKLRSALQKLQAENISLKAKMGTTNGEEKDLQKELNATVAEVSQLAIELTKTRAQVLASKSRLLESTAELKAAKEKKSVLKDLISDATATKQAIDEAYESIEIANNEVRQMSSVTQQLSVPPVVEDSDFLGGWGDDNAVQPPLPSTDTYDSLDLVDDPAPIESAEPSPQMNNYTQPPTYLYNTAGQNPVLPPPSSNMYNGGGYTVERGVLNREASEGFGEVMGGVSSPLPLQSSGYASMATTVSGASTFDSIPVAVSMKEVEDLQSKSKEADDVAKEADASVRQLTAQLEELRKVADEAENKSRAAVDKPVKKKGLLKRGGVPKKDAKEMEKLAMDARDKKEAMLLVQSQVKDAESVATATKQEAERLNKAAEAAQMAAAAAASMQDQSRTVVSTADSGYALKNPTQQSYGMASLPRTSNQAMYGMVSPTPPQHGEGFGGQPLGGYNSNIMGSDSAGYSIPTPSAMDDPYSNPFE